jgi:hypothetical protein
MECLWWESDLIFRLALRAPEEDEYLIILNFSTLKIWSFAAVLEEGYPCLII